MKHLVAVFILLVLVSFGAGRTVAQKTIGAASVYKQNGLKIVSPKQPGWRLLKTDKTETIFEKRDDAGVLAASVRVIHTNVFETEKERLTGWEALKQAEFDKFKQDHLHFNYERFKGVMCLGYDAIFPLDKDASNKYAHFNVNGFVIPLPDSKDTAIQIEMANYSDRRGMTEEMYGLAKEFYEHLVVPGLAKP